MKNELIYTKRYKDHDAEVIDECLNESIGLNVSLTEVLYKCNADHGVAQNGMKSEIPNNVNGIGIVPDEKRLKRADRFIRNAKSFSERYNVSADICRNETMVSVWLYFSTDILTGARKADFLQLADFADELTGIPHPQNTEGEYELAVNLNYMTGHSFINGRELHPFK
ncbi:MAG: hypothetical protein IJM20_01765 [Clostridia bacterium]|nr:hypothetical protein [Clostridia bacterium]